MINGFVGIIYLKKRKSQIQFDCFESILNEWMSV